MGRLFAINKAYGKECLHIIRSSGKETVKSDNFGRIEEIYEEFSYAKVESITFFQEKLGNFEDYNSLLYRVIKSFDFLKIDKDVAKIAHSYCEYVIKSNGKSFCIDYYDDGIHFEPVNYHGPRRSPYKTFSITEQKNPLLMKDLIKAGLEYARKDKYALGSHNCHFAMEAIYNVAADKAAGLEKNSHFNY